MWGNIFLRCTGSFEFRVGYAACGLIRVKSILPAMRKSTVLMVEKRVEPRALRLVAWKSPFRASMKPLVWRVWVQATMPSKCGSFEF